MDVVDIEAFAIEIFLTANAWGIYRKPLKRPGVLQFELRHRVSSTGRSIYHSLAGFNPPWVHSSGRLLEFDDALAH